MVAVLDSSEWNFMDPPDASKKDEEIKKRKGWWLRQWKRWKALIGPVLWLLARLIDKAIKHTHHSC